MRKYVIFTLFIILLATTISCSSGDKDTSTDLKSGNSRELSMYIMDYDTNAKNAVEKFNKMHKDVQIKTKALTAPADNLGSRLMYEFNSGSGPDIILCEEDTLPNLSVYFNKGTFYDLNTLIKDDKSFKQSRYFSKVLDYGLYKNNRYVIPLSFKIDALFSTKELLKKNNVEIQNIGIDQFTEAANKYMSASSGKEKYFVAAFGFNYLMKTSAVPFYSLENKTALFDTKEFEELLKKYSLLTGSICPSVYTASPAERNNLLSSERVIFQIKDTINPRYITQAYSSFKSEIQPVLTPLPSVDKTSHVLAKPEKYIGINSKCGNTKAAYEFVKLMMSTEYQDAEFMEGIPVNCEAYEQIKENCIKGIKGYDSWKTGGCKTANTLKKLYSQLDDLIEGVDRHETSDTYINAIIQDKLVNFTDGKSKAEDTSKAMQQEVLNYLKNGIMLASWESRKAELDKPKTGKEIKIYYMDYQQYIKNAIDLYTKKYNREDIIGECANTSYSELMKRTETEIMAGAGPELILFSKFSFNSISKAVSSGAFLDLTESLNNDKEYNPDKYYQSILSDGIFNGKRYYLPLFYEYRPFITTKEALKRNNINLDLTNLTWNKLAECAVEFQKTHKGQYFFKPFSFGYMIDKCGLQFVDYNKNVANFNTKEFKDLLEIYKSIYPTMIPDDKVDEATIGLLEHRRCIFVIQDFGIANPASVYCDYDRLRCDAGEEMVVVIPPTYSGEKRIFVSGKDVIGINSKCKNKEAAFNFIKILLSEDIQKGFGSNGYGIPGTEAPVNKNAYKLSFDNWLSVSKKTMSKDISEFVDRNANIMEYPQIKDEQIYVILRDTVKSYIDGTKTADQTAKEIDDKVNVLLNE